MANPSETGPSGIGTEVLKRTFVDGADNETATMLTVGEDKIVTILSIVITEIGATSPRTLAILVAPDGSGGNFLVRDTGSWTQNSTFIFSDKLVLTEGDVLKVGSNSTNFDVYVSYIEQEFE